jgi:predicted transposase YbfD/YdcC
VVRGEALHTQRALSVQILEAGGDYVWQVKENQPTLLSDIQEVFDPAPTAPGWNQVPRDLRHASSLDSVHGRLEKRTLTAGCFLNEYSGWRGLAQVFKLERHTVIRSTGQVRHQTVYGITSLSPEEASPTRLLHLMRDYWAIENRLHYRRDKILHEDDTRMTNPTQATAMPVINSLVIALVRRQGFTNLAAARRYDNAHLPATLNLLLSTAP